MERKRDYSTIYHRKSSARPSGPLAPAVLGLTILADEINLVGGMIDFDPSITTESVGFSVPGSRRTGIS